MCSVEVTAGRLHLIKKYFTEQLIIESTNRKQGRKLCANDNHSTTKMISDLWDQKGYALFSFPTMFLRFDYIIYHKSDLKPHKNISQ